MLSPEVVCSWDFFGGENMFLIGPKGGDDDDDVVFRLHPQFSCEMT